MWTVQPSLVLGLGFGVSGANLMAALATRDMGAFLNPLKEAAKRLSTYMCVCTIISIDTCIISVCVLLSFTYGKCTYTICTYIYIYVSVSAFVYVYEYVYADAYGYAYVCLYIHTYMHACMRTIHIFMLCPLCMVWTTVICKPKGLGQV